MESDPKFMCPTVAVTGPAGRVVVNATDLEHWKGRGYAVDSNQEGTTSYDPDGNTVIEPADDGESKAPPAV